MLQAARSAKKKLLYVRFVQIKSDPENTIPTIAFGIEGLSNFYEGSQQNFAEIRENPEIYAKNL